MTQEEKELLFKDLSARLLYGVKVQINSDIKKVVGVKNGYVVTKERGLFSTKEYITRIECCRPYLRPMSSMTEEERTEFSVFGFEVIDHINANHEECPKYQVIEVSNLSGITKVIDWLNAHLFDYRGLIPKGLALESKEGMYNIK